jgi:hypothetical protein
MSEHQRRIDKVLDARYLADLPEWPLDEPRRRHAEYLEIETEVSYVRRMTQARIEDDELRSTMRELWRLEQEASQQRRQPHQVIDRVDAELAARHKVGQA